MVFVAEAGGRQAPGAQVVFVFAHLGEFLPEVLKLAGAGAVEKGAVLQRDGFFAEAFVDFLQAPGRGDVVGDEVVGHGFFGLVRGCFPRRIVYIHMECSGVCKWLELLYGQRVCRE